MVILKIIIGLWLVFVVIPTLFKILKDYNHTK
ncbi:Uncharacterised protein [Clostridium disporicum]|uniref:Uncharacterized protein n=1 Tax=Clostridium disporicum TaxID=84024 RepID=A0A174D7Y0_9CLOT|nr:Uncharacterised protein [Clostridium disporicum]